MDYDAEVCRLLPWLRCQARVFVRGAEADDLVGDTLLRLFLHRRNFESVEELKSWCYVVMRNLHFSAVYRRKLIGFVSLDDGFDVPDGADVMDFMACREDVRMLRSLMRFVSVRALVLYAMGYSYAEIGVLMGVPLGTVQSRINAGRKMIRAKAEPPHTEKRKNKEQRTKYKPKDKEQGTKDKGGCKRL